MVTSPALNLATVAGAEAGLTFDEAASGAGDVGMGPAELALAAFPEQFASLEEVASGNWSQPIQKAIDSGLDVVLSRPQGYSTASTIELNRRSPGQRIITCNGAKIYPAFCGDVIRITRSLQSVSVFIDGKDCPSGDYSEVAAIRVGGPENPQGASLRNTHIEEFPGTGVIWEHGSHVLFSQVYVVAAGHDGIRATNRFNDNNHGLFLNTHITRCAGVGYNIQYSTETEKRSRAHQFINAKGFGCGCNFRFEADGCSGTIFSEKGAQPDVYTETSSGNCMSYLGDVSSFRNLRDLGAGNEIQGLSQFGSRWLHKRMYAESLVIQGVPMAGARRFGQVGNNMFVDELIGSKAPSSVVHRAQGNALRRDVFEGEMQFPSDDLAGKLVVAAAASGDVPISGMRVDRNGAYLREIEFEKAGNWVVTHTLHASADVSDRISVDVHMSEGRILRMRISLRSGDTFVLPGGSQVSWMAYLPAA